MALIQLVALQLIVFIGLIFFLRRILTRNISKATGHLQDLTLDYSSKQDRINKQLEEAKREAQDIITNSRRKAEALRMNMQKEMQAAHDTTLKEATQKTEQMVERAEHACELMKKDLDRKIDERASEKASELFRRVLPDTLRHQLHISWMSESIKGDFELAHLNIPKDISEADIVSAYPLDIEEKRILSDKLKTQLEKEIVLKENVDAGLIAGFIVTIGNVVIDGSLRYKIQSALKE